MDFVKDEEGLNDVDLALMGALIVVCAVVFKSSSHTIADTFLSLLGML